MEDSPSPIDGLILRLSGKPKPKVCFISTPSGDLPEHIERFEHAFSSAVCEPSHLAFFRKPGPHSIPLADFESHVLQQDVLYVGGGNTKSALGVWREWGLDRTLAKAYEAGALLCGMSAGAMCWFESGITDSFWGAGYRPLSCLGLLPGGCAVHYNSDPQRRPRLHAALQLGTIPSTVAIDDMSAVLYEEGRVGGVYKWATGQGAYLVDAQGTGIVETPLHAETLRVEA